MITATLRAKIIAVLGKKYSPRIIEYLTGLGVFNDKSEPFKPNSIQKIVNGDRESIVIENHILDLVAEVQKTTKLLRDKQSKVLKTR